jgi:hypothetical protein
MIVPRGASTKSAPTSFGMRWPRIARICPPKFGGIDGESLLTALVAGYESSIRIAECVGIRPEALMGWHTPPFYGSIGSAVCAGKIMGLDEEQMFQAIGIAADNAVDVGDIFQQVLLFHSFLYGGNDELDLMFLELLTKAINDRLEIWRGYQDFVFHNVVIYLFYKNKYTLSQACSKIVNRRGAETAEETQRRFNSLRNFAYFASLRFILHRLIRYRLSAI